MRFLKKCLPIISWCQKYQINLKNVHHICQYILEKYNNINLFWLNYIKQITLINFIKILNYFKKFIVFFSFFWFLNYLCDYNGFF